MTSSLYAPVEKKITELRARYNSTKGTLKESRRNVAEVMKCFDEKRFDDMAKVGCTVKANIKDELESLESTLTLDLIHAPKRWFITNMDALICPAGFNSSDRVFVLSEGKYWHGTNRRPTATHLENKVYDLSQIG